MVSVCALLYVHYQHFFTVLLPGFWICVDVLAVMFVFVCHSLMKSLTRLTYTTCITILLGSVGLGVLHGAMVRVCVHVSVMYVCVYYSTVLYLMCAHMYSMSMQVCLWHMHTEYSL